MRHINFIVISILFLLLLNSCSINNSTYEEEIDKNAKRIAESFDSTNIGIFKIWNYIPRGPIGIWYKNPGDSSSYRCIYLDKVDSIELRVFEYKNFIKDFDIKLSYDTSVWQISLLKYKNDLFKVTGVDSNGRNVVLADRVIQDSIFGDENPMLLFKELTKIVDTFNIYGIHYNENLGGIIQFYLSAQHILTYIPDTSWIDPMNNQVWINEFANGREIKKHWNLIKLKKPIDNE